MFVLKFGSHLKDREPIKNTNPNLNIDGGPIKVNFGLRFIFFFVKMLYNQNQKVSKWFGRGFGTMPPKKKMHMRPTGPKNVSKWVFFGEIGRF